MEHRLTTLRRLLLVAGASTISFLASACSSASDNGVGTSESEQTSWGGSCASSAINITPTIANGNAYTGTVSGTASPSLSTCGNRNTRGTLLRYDLPSYGNYRVDITSALPASHPTAKAAAVVVRRDCTDIIHEIACNAQPAQKSTFVGYHLSGAVYIHVEGDFFAQGFELRITKLPFECQQNSDCGDWPDGRCNQLNGNCISTLKCRGMLGNCDSSWSNGCETDLSTSTDNCGTCRSACNTAGGHASAAACNAGKCQLTCDTNFANCDGKAKNGCEADLNNEGLSCGACGTTCGGGVCKAGACQTTGVEVATIPNTAGDWSDDELNRLAIGDTHVFVSRADYVGTLWAAPKGGGTPALVADRAEFFDTANGAVVWADTNGVYKWTEATSTKLTLVTLSGREWISDVAVVGGATYLGYRDKPGIDVLLPGASTLTQHWPGDATAKVARIAAAGTGIVTREVGWSGYAMNWFSTELTFLPAGGSPSTTGTIDTKYTNGTFAADATHAYYGNLNGLWRVPLSGGAPTKIWSGPMVFSVALDGSDVYFAHCLYDRRAARGLRIPKAGGTATEVVFDEIANGENGETWPCGPNIARPASRYLATDASWIYWIRDMTIRRVHK